jgi:hypothetical protein
MYLNCLSLLKERSIRLRFLYLVLKVRKGTIGLALLVQEGLGRDPFAGDVFVFRGRARHAPWPSCQMILIRSPRRPLKCRDHQRADQASGFPEPDAQGSGIRGAYRYGQSQATPAHCPVWQSSAFKHVEDPRQRFRVKLCIHPDPLPVAKIDLDQSVPGGR